MIIRLSKHAKIRMKERGIDYKEVASIIENPVQLVYDSWKDVYIAVGRDGCAIVYSFHGEYVEVLTVLGRREYEALASRYMMKRYKLIK